MANPVTTDDIEVRWRPFSTPEVVTAQALLDDTWALILQKIPDIEARLEAETLDVALVRMVACAAVLRVMKNLDGKQEEQLEDYRYRMGSDAAPGTLYLDEDELILLRAAPPVPSGAFTIRPYTAPVSNPSRPGPPYLL
jgi:hypothetical protein